MKLSKFILPIVSVIVLALIYYIYFTPTKELGSFSKFRGGSEINQKINVAVVQLKGFERDVNGNIISFYARDKNNVEVKVELHEPAPEEIVNAEVVELIGHMHGTNFNAANVFVLK